MKSKIIFALLLSVLLAARFSSRAQSIFYSDFGPNSSYSTATVWGVSGASVSGGYRGQAQFFTPSVSGFLTQVKVATYHVSGSQLCNFFIALDSGANTPGTILETFSNMITPTGVLTLNSVLDPLLTAGTEYWLCMEPATATSYNGWYYNNQNMNSGFAFERSAWSWAFIPGPAPSSGAFEIRGTTVPETSTTWLGFLAGGLWLCWRATRGLTRRNQGTP